MFETEYLIKRIDGDYAVLTVDGFDENLGYYSAASSRCGRGCPFTL